VVRVSVEECLWRIGAVQRGLFKLSSGKISNVYVDLRKLPSHPAEFREVVRSMSRLAERFNVDYVCGIAVGGLPLATALAYELGKPLIYVRKERKDHGTMKQLEGDYSKGARVLLVDDVATTGGTLSEATRVLRGEGLEVEAALVVVDREEGAREALRGLGVELFSLTTLRRLLEVGGRAEGA
jgi:orotate phosphoribosyltransferase